MKKRAVITLSWLLVIACMMTIFLLSSQTGENSAELSDTVMGPVGRLITFLFGEEGHNIFRKFAHFFEFAGLSFLLYNAFFQTKKSKKMSPYIPFFTSVIYAVSDEVHQLFVDGRACRIFDIGVDTLGIVTGLAVFYCIVKCIEKLKKIKIHECA
ncbi:MAG: VanZ family protein [Clostridia bacterium]|nr:VanZ family protein [Clostridia bacterium]